MTRRGDSIAVAVNDACADDVAGDDGDDDDDDDAWGETASPDEDDTADDV